MRKPIIAAAAFAALIASAPAASAAELLIVSILPGSSTWTVDGRNWGIIDPDSFSSKDHPGGEAKIEVMDENMDGQTRVVTLDPAQLATAKGRSFWCVGGRLDDATEKPKIVMMPKANCQKFIDGNV